MYSNIENLRKEIRLEFFRVFLEELSSNECLVPYSVAIRGCLVATPHTVINPLGESLLKLKNLTAQNETEVRLGLQLLSSVVSLFPGKSYDQKYKF